MLLVRIEQYRPQEVFVKGLIIAAAAAVGLVGCIAVPAPYSDGYYYPGPSVGVGVYPPPVVVYGPRYGYRYRGHSGYWR